ncbi:RNA polymerase sigma factor [Candidatus Ulvibacter alkanivorans]|uniref:RNA polymerase sigma factor n=1 Tax=Candidatus Ulvibacter alkanivorans TaxID=2267620 RepID=UPI000DF176B0|nr:RNA polymerase sigma factor [Candidatus Ulvibacter alkanivorans]
MIEEQVLVNALQSEDDREAAFRSLVSQYKQRLYWHIRKIVLDHDDADDVLQNTFIKVYKNIDSFKGQSKLYTWMYRIATNESLTFLKRKARRANTTLEEVKENALANLEADVYFEGDQIQLQLQKAIAELPEKQQLIFNMKYFEDHTYEELSEILDTSVGGLKSSYHIAVKKVTAFLKSDETF